MFSRVGVTTKIVDYSLAKAEYYHKSILISILMESNVEPTLASKSSYKYCIKHSSGGERL